jgi:type I restriction enzyme M protein
LPTGIFKNRGEFERVLDGIAKKAGLRVPAPARRAILSAFSERDETAAICRDKDGDPEPDPELRDTESVPLTETIQDFFDREVRPHVPDAWIGTTKRDPKDDKVGTIGYEINFNRHFYRYKPPRPLEEMLAASAQAFRGSATGSSFFCCTCWHVQRMPRTAARASLSS